MQGNDPKIRLLVVEDDEDVIKVLDCFISHARFEIAYARTFMQAMELMQVNAFQMVVTDYHFPGGNGNLIAEALSGTTIPVYLHTSDPDNSAIRKDLFDFVFDKLHRNLLKELK